MNLLEHVTTMLQSHQTQHVPPKQTITTYKKNTSSKTTAIALVNPVLTVNKHMGLNVYIILTRRVRRHAPIMQVRQV